MTVQLSSLRVAPELDATKYTAGAQQKVAADKAMAASNREVATTATQTDAKITQSGDVLARLSRQYVDGYASAQKFNSELNTLARGIDAGKISMNQALPILDGIYKKFGLTADATQFAAKGQVDFANAVVGANMKIDTQIGSLSRAAGEWQIYISQLKQAQQAENSLQAAAANQNKFNLVLNVNPSSGAARGSASVFEAEFERMDALGKLKATQIGQNFSADLNSSLVSGISRSARDAASAFQDEFDRIDQIARWRAQQTGQNFQEDLNARLGVGRRVNSASDSASVFAQAGTGGPRFGMGQVQGLSYQANDIVTMALMGAPVSQIAASQGGQIFQNLQQNEGGVTGSLKAIKSGAGEAAAAVVAFLGPIGMIASGFGLAAVAAGAYYVATREKAKTLDEALKENEANVRLIGDAYGYAARQAKAMPTIDGRGADLLAAASAQDLRLAIANNSRDVLGDVSHRITPGRSSGGYDVANAEFKPFADAIDHLRATAKNGTPDIAGFRDMVTKDWSFDPLNQGLTTAATKLLDMTDTAMRAVEALKQLDRMRAAQYDVYSQYGMSRNAGQGSKAAQDANDDRLRADSFGPYGHGIPIPEQRPNDIDRLDTDPLQGFMQDFSKSSSQQVAGLKDQQAALWLTGAALEEFTFRQQALNAALSKNLELGPDQIAIIEKQAKAYGEAAEALARAHLAKDLAFERDQMFRSPEDQRIASRLQGAGQAVDLNSPEAQQMRDMAQFANAKDLATGFLSDFKSELMRNGGDVGKALGTSILNALSKSMDDQLGKLFDTLASWLASAITGQRPGLGGGVATGVGFVANTTLSDLLGGGANDNYAPGAVTRAPLGAAGSGGVAAQAWNFFKSKGLADHQVAGILGNISAESAFKPTAVGDAGNAFGLFQHNDRAPALLNAIGGKGNLGDVQGQLDFAWKELNSSESGALARLKAAPDVRSATAAFAGFERPRGFSLGNPEGADNFSGRLSGAEQALQKFGGTAAKVTGNLDGLDSTVTNTVKSLAGGIDGQGGLASILDGLKPGNFQANTTLSDILGAGGGAAAQPSGGSGIFGTLLSFIPKLFGFAGGTDFAPGGLARINELGGEIVDLPRGSRVIPHDVSMRMAANANRPAAAAPAPKVDLHVHVNGASGDDHVRMLARQGAQQAIGEYHENLASGGIGDLQRRYNSQKG